MSCLLHWQVGSLPLAPPGKPLIHQLWLFMLQEGVIRGEESSCCCHSAEDADTTIETCLNTVLLAQRATQTHSIKMTTSWAKLFTGGKKILG